MIMLLWYEYILSQSDTCSSIANLRNNRGWSLATCSEELSCYDSRNGTVTPYNNINWKTFICLKLCCIGLIWHIENSKSNFGYIEPCLQYIFYGQKSISYRRRTCNQPELIFGLHTSSIRGILIFSVYFDEFLRGIRADVRFSKWLPPSLIFEIRNLCEFRTEQPFVIYW